MSAIESQAQSGTVPGKYAPEKAKSTTEPGGGSDLSGHTSSRSPGYL